MRNFSLFFILPFVFSITVVTEPSEQELTELRNEALKFHNLLRANHTNTSSLSLNDDLNTFAQNYCSKLAQSNKLEHSTDQQRNNIGTLSGYSGENLFWYSNKKFQGIAQMAVMSWYNEIKNYDYNNPGYNQNVGHFTQLIWKSTNKVGFGFAYSEFGTYVCANYYPGGNYLGQFSDNVLPLKTPEEKEQEQEKEKEKEKETNPSHTSSTWLKMSMIIMLWVIIL